MEDINTSKYFNDENKIQLSNKTSVFSFLTLTFKDSTKNH